MPILKVTPTTTMVCIVGWGDLIFWPDIISTYAWENNEEGEVLKTDESILYFI